MQLDCHFNLSTQSRHAPYCTSHKWSKSTISTLWNSEGILVNECVDWGKTTCRTALNQELKKCNSEQLSDPNINSICCLWFLNVHILQDSLCGQSFKRDNDVTQTKSAALKSWLEYSSQMVHEHQHFAVEREFSWWSSCWKTPKAILIY